MRDTESVASESAAPERVPTELAEERLEALLSHTVSLPGAWVGDKPEWETVVASIGNRLFAIVLHHSDSRLLVNLKLEPDDVLAVKQQFSWIEPGFHMNKRHWVSMNLTHPEYDGEIAAEMMSESQQIVLGKLTRKVREAVLLEHAAGTPPRPSWHW